MSYAANSCPSLSGDSRFCLFFKHKKKLTLSIVFWILVLERPMFAKSSALNLENANAAYFLMY